MNFYFVIKVNRQLAGKDSISGYIKEQTKDLVDIFNATCFDSKEEVENTLKFFYSNSTKDVFTIEAIYK